MLETVDPNINTLMKNDKQACVRRHVHSLGSLVRISVSSTETRELYLRKDPFQFLSACPKRNEGHLAQPDHATDQPI